MIKPSVCVLCLLVLVGSTACKTRPVDSVTTSKEIGTFDALAAAEYARLDEQSRESFFEEILAFPDAPNGFLRCMDSQARLRGYYNTGDCRYLGQKGLANQGIYYLFRTDAIYELPAGFEQFGRTLVKSTSGAYSWAKIMERDYYVTLGDDGSILDLSDTVAPPYTLPIKEINKQPIVRLSPTALRDLTKVEYLSSVANQIRRGIIRTMESHHAGVDESCPTLEETTRLVMDCKQLLPAALVENFVQ